MTVQLSPFDILDTPEALEKLANAINETSGGLVSQAPVTVSSADILAGGPVTIIPAQGPNTIIIVLAAYYALGAGTAYTATDSLASGLFYVNLNSPIAADQGDQSVELGGSGAVISGCGLMLAAVTNANTLVNAPVVWGVTEQSAGAWTVGNAPLTITVIYAVFKLSP